MIPHDVPPDLLRAILENPARVKRTLLQDAEAIERMLAIATARELAWAALVPEWAAIWHRIGTQLRPLAPRMRVFAAEAEGYLDAARSTPTED